MCAALSVSKRAAMGLGGVTAAFALRCWALVAAPATAKDEDARHQQSDPQICAVVWTAKTMAGPTVSVLDGRWARPWIDIREI